MGICSVMKRWTNKRKGWCTKTGRKKGWVTAAFYLDLFHKVTSFTFMIQHRTDRKSLLTLSISIPMLFSITFMLRYYNTYTYGRLAAWWREPGTASRAAAGALATQAGPGRRAPPERWRDWAGGETRARLLACRRWSGRAVPGVAARVA